MWIAALPFQSTAAIQKENFHSTKHSCPFSNDGDEPPAKKPAIKSKQMSAVLQVTDYAAKTLHAHFGHVFMINFAALDTRVNIWYFNRQGAIQTTGFDFIDHLPYFLVLLFILLSQISPSYPYLTFILSVPCVYLILLLDIPNMEWTIGLVLDHFRHFQIVDQI
ncbi:hypothetical protein E1B28_002600 [Marasmius oreades]|uniref:Uncharacterized protein n=1 Tax=Marasmius oreades TaxID=181124 RepID=A0A9P7UM11_9AGAR|nr:uncharacterized protein E1B28_002600 [Marasmius oreades]KAG7086660.1 hypothetical protein E1B28_002600 [Marasmius oreades]